MKYFVLMEVGKKQDYIFRSNRLKENIGASLIIKHLTECLPEKMLDKYNGESILSGGGKGLYKFKSQEEAIDFIKELSYEVLKKFQGVELYFVRSEIDIEKDNVVSKIKELYIKLGKKKSRRANAIGQIALGIEEVCTSTKNAAVARGNEGLVSEEIYSKLKFFEENKKDYFNGQGIKHHMEIDNIKDNDKSYIAVIHIDGNSMGNKFTKLADYYEKKVEDNLKYNEEYLEKLSILSETIEKTYQDAFQKVILQSKEESDKNSSEEVYSSIRPIIVAGDDITFIAKAKHAIKLTKLFIEEVKKAKVTIGKETENLNAAGGIAFIKASHPFDKAYELAEQLTANCKQVIKNNTKDSSMLDWHIVQGEDEDNINHIRKKHYKAKGLILNLRPLYIGENEINSYENFKETLNIVQNSGIVRSKIKNLRTEFLKGEEVAKRYISYYGLENYLDYMDNVRLDRGVRNNIAVFFDAIEIMDLVKEV